MREPATMERGLTRAELAELAHELRREHARVARALAPGESSDVLHELEQALERIDEGRYGLCAGCGRRISFGRLLVMPATQACVGCAW